MTEGRGVVQWVVPKKTRISTGTRTNGKENKSKNNGHNSNRLSVQDISGSQLVKFDNPKYSSGGHPNSQDNPNYAQKIHYNHETGQYHATTVRLADDSLEDIEEGISDEAICKTICVIVEEYLKELRDHQRQINEARAQLIRDGPQTCSVGLYIAHNDVSRLRVRDEQTKAAISIKQLLTYLRELSSIKEREGLQSDPVSEETHIRLSDLRNEIINTLNDFVISNRDIDMPIIDPDSPSEDYDLCVEAQRSNRDIREMDISQSSGCEVFTTMSINSYDLSSSTGPEQCQQRQYQTQRRPLARVVKNPNLDHETAPLDSHMDLNYKLMTINDDYELIQVDERRRKIVKLEKDTIELRNLFSDFYNLVKSQGEQVDKIEDNLVMAAQHISETRNHLITHPNQAVKVLIPVTGCITGALIGGPIGLLVGGKLSGFTIVFAGSLLGLLSSLGARKCIVQVKKNQ